MSSSDIAAVTKTFSDSLLKVVEALKGVKPATATPKVDVRAIGKHIKRPVGVVPLGMQPDRFVAFVGLSAAKSDVSVRAENAGVFLPGLNEEIWRDWARYGRGGTDFEVASGDGAKVSYPRGANETNVKSHITRFKLAKDVFESKDLDVLEVSAAIVQSSDGFDEKDEPKFKYEILSCPLRGGSRTADDGFTFDKGDKANSICIAPWTNLLPAIPTRVCHLQSKKSIQFWDLDRAQWESDDKGELKKWEGHLKEGRGKTYHEADEIPDYAAYFMQFGTCKDIALAQLCNDASDDDDTRFDLPDGVTFFQAFQGYLRKIVAWHKARKLEDAHVKLGLANDLIGKIEAMSKEASFSGDANSWVQVYKWFNKNTDHKLAYACTYYFGDSVAKVNYDPKHPLALGNLGAHYCEWALRKLNAEIALQIPTMMMARARIMIQDRFFRTVGTLETGGRFHNFPLRDFASRGVASAKDVANYAASAAEKAHFDREMDKEQVRTQILFMYAYISQLTTRIRVALRAAAGIDAKNPSFDVESKLAAAHLELRKQSMSFIEMITNRGMMLNEKLTRAVQLRFKHDALAKESLSDFRVFERSPELAHILGLTMALALWGSHILARPMSVKRAKAVVETVTDQTIQAALGGTASSPEYLEKLQRKAAEAHSASALFMRSGMLDSMCRGESKRVKLVYVANGQDVRADDWDWKAVGDEGDKVPEFKGPNKDNNEKLMNNGGITMVCDGLAIVFTDDPNKPTFIPTVTMGWDLLNFEAANNPDATFFMKGGDGSYGVARASAMISALRKVAPRMGDSLNVEDVRAPDLAADRAKGGKRLGDEPWAKVAAAA